MTVEVQKDLAVFAANAAPGTAAAAAARTHTIDPAGILTWLTILLVAIQVAYYLWKWCSEYQERARQRKIQEREEAQRLAASHPPASNDPEQEKRA